MSTEKEKKKLCQNQPVKPLLTSLLNL